MPTGDFPRHESAFAKVDHLDQRLTIRGTDAKLTLDFDLGTRSVS